MSKTDTMSVYFKVKGAKEAERDLKTLGNKGTLALNGITATAKPASSALLALNATIGKVNSSMATFTGLAGAYFGLQSMRSSVDSIVQTNSEIQKLSAAMEVAESSITGANNVLDKLSTLATQTPYSLDALTQAWIKLKNLGLEPSEQALISYGNTSSAMGKDIMQFIEAIADASTMEFERLKEFGIKAKQANDTVSFTFQGTTTKIAKNASDIEKYLRGLGQVQFAGSMQKQMNTIGGATSNLSDEFVKFQKRVGDSEFNSSVQNFLTSMSDVVASSQDTAKSLGLALSSVTDGMTLVVKNIDVLKDAVLAFGGFKVIQTGAMMASVAYRQLALTMQISSIIAGRAATAQIASMAALSTAAKGLSTSLTMLGGPLGVIAIAGFAVYEFAKKEDAAAVASRKYAKELKEVEENSKNLTTATEKLNKATEKGQRLAILSEIDEAKESIKDIQDQIRNGEYSDEGWWESLFSSNTAEVRIMEFKNKMHDGEMSVEQFHNTLLKLGESDIKFRKPAQLLDDRINALKAAELALKNSQDKLSRFDNPNIKNKVTTEVETFVSTETLESLMEKASSSVYQLESAMSVQLDPNSWIFGALNGLDELNQETTNYADMAEKTIKNAFKSMENSIVSFVKTGKLQFDDLVNSILEDILRMQIRQNIIQPISNGISAGLSAWAGTSTPAPTVPAGVNHSGGLTGSGVGRKVPIEVFTNALRYHTGSVIHQDEVPVITQKGEGIISRQQMNELIRDKKRKSFGNIYVNVIHKSTGEKVKSEASMSENANGMNIDILVEEFEGKVANNVARNRGPLNGVLNNKFKANGVMR